MHNISTFESTSLAAGSDRLASTTIWSTTSDVFAAGTDIAVHISVNFGLAQRTLRPITRRVRTVYLSTSS